MKSKIITYNLLVFGRYGTFFLLKGFAEVVELADTQP